MTDAHEYFRQVAGRWDEIRFVALGWKPAVTGAPPRV
jgi:hypothetical protein